MFDFENLDVYRLALNFAKALRITNKGTEWSAIKKFFDWGISEVLVTKASRGSVVYCGEKPGI